jgi:carbon starvation protein
MIFMFAVTLTALVMVAKTNFAAEGSLVIGILASVLFILAIVLIINTIQVFFGGKSKDKEIGA